MTVYSFNGVFSLFRKQRLGWRSSSYEIAAPLVVRHMTCPYCGAIMSALVLAKLVGVKSIPKDMVLRGKGGTIISEEFRRAHLSNPIRCPNPSCGREFLVFASISYDVDGQTVRDIDVKIEKMDDPVASKLINWPHKGLVMKEVFEFSPFRIRIYDDWDHFLQVNGGDEDLVPASNMPRFPDTGEAPQPEDSKLPEGVKPPREIAIHPNGGPRRRGLP